MIGNSSIYDVIGNRSIYDMIGNRSINANMLLRFSFHRLNGITITYRDGRTRLLDHTFIRGSKIRFFVCSIIHPHFP
jgi:hypothetical protein